MEISRIHRWSNLSEKFFCGARSAKCCAKGPWRIKMLGAGVLSELPVLDLLNFSRMILIGAV